MNMRLITATITLVASQVLFGCDKPMTPAQKIKMLESQKMSIFADLHRQQAECNAQAIESANDQHREKVVSACWEVYRLSSESSQLVLSSLDKRIAEVTGSELPAKTKTEDQPKLIPFNGKLDGEK